jgi:hypothetical protein
MNIRSLSQVLLPESNLESRESRPNNADRNYSNVHNQELTTWIVLWTILHASLRAECRKSDRLTYAEEYHHMVFSVRTMRRQGSPSCIYYFTLLDHPSLKWNLGALSPIPVALCDANSHYRCCSCGHFVIELRLSIICSCLVLWMNIYRYH